MTRTMRRLRRSRCEMDQTCTGVAVGELWPPKHIGEPMPASARACAAHLDAAQGRGWTVSRDAHAALFGNQE